MNKRQRIADERLEVQLRSLPEVDPPANLLSRVMEEVLAGDVDAVPSPGRRRIRRVPLWQPAVVSVAFATLTLIVLVRYAAPVVGILGKIAGIGTGVIRFVVDASIGVVSGASAWLAKAAVTTSVFANVARTVADVVFTEFGSLIVAAVCIAIALQFVLLAMVGRRSEAP